MDPAVGGERVEVRTAKVGPLDGRDRSCLVDPAVGGERVEARAVKAGPLGGWDRFGDEGVHVTGHTLHTPWRHDPGRPRPSVQRAAGSGLLVARECRMRGPIHHVTVPVTVAILHPSVW